jgi:AraC-like DNA-binding protein
VGPTSSVIVLRPLLGALSAVEQRALLTGIGLTPEDMVGGERRIPFTLVTRAWVIALEQVGDPDLGLHIAESTPIGAYAVVDHLARACPTLGDALDRVLKLQRLLHDAVRFDLVTEGDESYVAHELTVDDAARARHGAELAFASLVLRSRELTRTDVGPTEVRFNHEAPSDISEHQRIFRCSLRFGAPRSEMRFATASLATPIRSYEPSVLRVLDGYADSLLRALPEDDGTVTSVRRVVAARIAEGEPSLCDVAMALSTSARTLQRRLGDAGLSYREVVDAIRRELAADLVRAGDVRLADVAVRLGFSEPSAFHRAFRRWFGASPLEWRSRTRAKSPAAS